MAPRNVSAEIKAPNGQAREGLRIDFRAEDPAASTYAITDAGGVFVAPLEPLVPYLISSENPFTVNGQSFPAGTMFRVVVPEEDPLAEPSDAPVAIGDVTVEIIDASRPTLLRMITDLQARVTALEPTP
jgi:hypothetical protein